MRERVAAVLLAGGRASRLAGIDKLALRVRGRTLLEHALDAVVGVAQIVVVGQPRSTSGTPAVHWTREHPPGSGPVAGLAAGLRALDEYVVPARRTASASWVVVVLAGDQPGVTSATVDRLLTVLADAPGAVGAILVDTEGRRQWLIGVWREWALRSAMPARSAGTALRSVLAPLSPLLVPAEPGEAQDVDTQEDLDRVRDS